MYFDPDVNILCPDASDVYLHKTEAASGSRATISWSLNMSAWNAKSSLSYKNFLKNLKFTMKCNINICFLEFQNLRDSTIEISLCCLSMY